MEINILIGVILIVLGWVILGLAIPIILFTDKWWIVLFLPIAPIICNLIAWGIKQ